MKTDRERAEARMVRAKAMMTRAAEAALAGNLLADDFTWMALAELEAARSELAQVAG
ncbi:MAG: hypothetical protein SGJ23_15875 [Alphaproteobacteria bacterium]|nr:hypothetical protein [Alphaproteobacteria bacterium]